MVCAKLYKFRQWLYVFLPVIILGVCLGYIQLTDSIYIIQRIRPPQPVTSSYHVNETEFNEMHTTDDARDAPTNQQLHMLGGETRNTSLESNSSKEDLFNWYDLVVTEWVNHTLVRRTSSENSSKHLFIVVESHGRLGNQMFIYAALYGASVLYPERTPCLIQKLVKKTGFKKMRLTFPNLTINYHPFCEDPINPNKVFIHKANKTNHLPDFNFIENMPNKNIHLLGYYQSFWYFDHVKDVIRREFQYSSNTTEQVNIFFEETVPQEWRGSYFTRVGIHVRRGDRVGMSMTEKGFIQPPMEYFYNAMNYFLERHERVQFVVASDDIPWCKENLKAEHIVYSGQTYNVDMAIMTSCDHVIITLGSFSWWIGWLNKGTTIYHLRFPPPGTYESMHHRREFWYPPDDEFNHWVPLL